MVEPENEDSVLEGENVPVEGEDMEDDNDIEEELVRHAIENMENIVKQLATHLSNYLPLIFSVKWANW
jgi:hypothetical protein